MKIVTILMAAFTVLSGCAALTADTVVDLSTGEKTARIDKGPSCRINWPVEAGSIIVDAGPVMFTLRCIAGTSTGFWQAMGQETGIDLSSVSSREYIFYPFNFVAEAGHIYEVTYSSRNRNTPDDRVFMAEAGCIGGHALLDITADAHVVGCMGGFHGRMEKRLTDDAYVCEVDHSQHHGFSTDPWPTRCVGELKPATFMPRREMNQEDIHSYRNVCIPSKGGFRERVVLLVVDAGSVTIDATCSRVIPVTSDEYAASTSYKINNPPGILVSKTSSFDFDAQSGHIYTFSQKNEECMSLLDITSEETVVACEPYQELD